MCTIVFSWHGCPGSWQTPVIVAANRDELRSRPSLPPQPLVPDRSVWGGRDALAGGTWLAVHTDGRVAAVTNRHPGGVIPQRDPSRRTRGFFAIDLLSGGDAAAEKYLHGVQPADYNPVNVLYLGYDHAWVLHVDDDRGARIVDVPEGIHVLGDTDLDIGDAKTSSIRDEALDAVSAADSATVLRDAWRSILRSHHRRGAGPGSAACIHEEMFGTVSSATVAVSRTGVEYEHAEGPPCVTPYVAVPIAG